MYVYEENNEISPCTRIWKINLFLQKLDSQQSMFIYLFLEGLENSWKRHHNTIEHLWAGLEEMGLRMFVKDKVKFFKKGVSY